MEYRIEQLIEYYQYFNNILHYPFMVETIILAVIWAIYFSNHAMKSFK